MAIESLPRKNPHFQQIMCEYYGREPGKDDIELFFLICSEQLQFCTPWGNFKKQLIYNETPAGFKL